MSREAHVRPRYWSNKTQPVGGWWKAGTVRSAARKAAPDEPDPERDLAAEAVAQIQEDARQQQQTRRLLAQVAAAVAASGHDCAEIDRLTSELVIKGIRQAERNAAMGELSAALRDHAAALFADDTKFSTGWDARGRQMAAQVPGPRKPRPGQQHPIMALVPDAAAAAD